MCSIYIYIYLVNRGQILMLSGRLFDVTKTEVRQMVLCHLTEGKNDWFCVCMCVCFV